MECFKIRTYGRMELAQAYCPNMNPRAAYHKLTLWIDRYPHLREQLTAIGASPKSRTRCAVTGIMPTRLPGFLTER